MREVRIRDTLSGELRALEPRDPPRGRASTPAGRPSTRAIHVGNARPYVIFMLLRRFLAALGYEPRLVINVTDINDKIYAAAREAGVPSDAFAREMTRAYVEDTDRLGLGRPDAEPLASETIAEIVELIEALIESRPRLRVRGGRLLPRPQLPRLRQALQPRPRRDGPGRGGGHREPEGGPARLRALEGAQARRGHRLAVAVGRGPARLAHRVLGDGREAPRAPTSTIHGGGVDLSSPTTRTRSPRPRPRAACRWRGSGCTTGWSGWPRRRCRSRSATSSSSPRRSTATAARPWSPTWSPATTASRSSSRSEALEEAGARVERIRNFVRELPEDDDGRGRFVAERPRGVPRRARRRLQHAAGARRAVRAGRRGQPARRWPAPRAALEEMLPLLGLESLLEPGGGGRIRRPSGCSPSARRRARRATSSGPTGSATSSPSAGCEVRDTPEGAAAGPASRLSDAGARDSGDRLRPAPGRRGASAAGGGCTACGPPDDLPAGELTRLAGSPDHQGVVAEVDPYPYADPRALLERPDALVVALDQVQDPRNLGAVCRSAEAAGRGGRGDPVAALGGGDRGRLQGLGGRGRAPAGRPGPQPRRLARRGQGGRRLGLRGGVRAPTAPYAERRPDRARSCSCWGARGGACAGGSAETCDLLVSIPLRGRVGSLNVSAAAAVLLFEAVRQRGGRAAASSARGRRLHLQRILRSRPRGLTEERPGGLHYAA